MKRIALAVFAVVIGVGAMVQDAEAKRVGGGKSSGVSRDSTVMKRDAVPAKPAAAPTQAAAPAAAAAPPSGMSRWLGPLAGLAAGIGLAALFSHLGMGEGMANVMMILALAMAAVFAVRWLMKRRQSVGGMQPAMQYAGAPTGMESARSADSSPPVSAGGMGAGPVVAAAVASHVPADFDVDGFLRQAKLNFIRMQAANDRGDMEDIRQFCTPEMAAEIQMQFQERNQLAQETNVLQLNAELLDVSTESDWALASVRFSGQLVEEANAGAVAFSEVWHLTKLVDGGQGWRIAGIQQS